MKRSIFALWLILLAQNCDALEWFSPLTRQDFDMQIAFTGLVLVDWAQTKTFIGYGYRESNPGIGSSPNQIEIDQKIMTGLIFHWLFIWAIPREFRRLIQIESIVLDGEAIIFNFSYSAYDKYPMINSEVW